MNDTDRKNIDLYLSYKLLFLTTPVLYGLIITKIFEWYHFTFITQLILFFLPFIVGLFVKLKTKDIPNNTQNILQTMSFYSIPFFLAVNVCFDFSKPSSKGYLIIDKTSSIEEKYDSEGSYETTIYEFKAIPKEKMNPITFWMDISATKHSGLHPKAEILTHKVFLTIENKKYEILTSKTNLFKKIKDSDYLHTYQLREYTKPVVIHVKRTIYTKFEKGNYLDIETYSGLFGIGWTYYHWKHKA
ncbi:hypothetical protein [Chryseobacterium sp. OSA05B]|uniref:hypothetical protein n=1 Tax=Chryseobacterium sp. OSA05B TaxID=2862650 RepID=UPI001CBD0B7D|nr:hypothetical protein [Chryseobacterium sp. OSA05B]